MSQKAVVIGSGIGGIAMSIRLAIKGFAVTVFDAQEKPGGKLNEFYLGPYRFDFGPSLFTMPELVDELFLLAGKNPEDYFQYQPLDIINNYFWEDGTTLQAHADPNQFSRDIQETFDVKPSTIQRYLGHSDMIRRYTENVFLRKSLHRLDTYLNRQIIGSILHLPRMDIFRTMHRVNKRRLKHPKLVQLFDRYATYNGSNPYSAPGILNVIPSLEHIGGASFPIGGMYTITRSLVRLAKELGVEFWFQEPVHWIKIKNGKAESIETTKRTFAADLVVSNMDIYPTYKKLMPKLKAPDSILNQERSSSALVFYWGIKRIFPQLGLHNIFFSKDYKIEFDTLFTERQIASDPTVYVYISSKNNAMDAPTGSENWFVMVNAPYNSGQDWKKINKETRRNVLDKLNRMLKTDVESLIEAEDILDPQRIEAKTSSCQGALYGNSSNSKFAAFLRHRNFHRKIKNLYFCGGSVHPGGGIPLCLLSAKIVDSMIKKSS